jgi:uridine kinase
VTGKHKEIAEGTNRYRRVVFDFRADRPVLAPDDKAPVDAVLIFDGVFLQRPELARLWDYRVYVDVPFAAAVARAERHDGALFGSAAAVRARYERRYIPGQRLYFDAARPRERADAVVGNDDPSHPTLAFRGAV